jgi:hypothetical protein
MVTSLLVCAAVYGVLAVTFSAWRLVDRATRGRAARLPEPLAGAR